MLGNYIKINNHQSYSKKIEYTVLFETYYNKYN